MKGNKSYAELKSVWENLLKLRQVDEVVRSLTEEAHYNAFSAIEAKIEILAQPVSLRDFDANSLQVFRQNQSQLQSFEWFEKFAQPNSIVEKLKKMEEIIDMRLQTLLADTRADLQSANFKEVKSKFEQWESVKNYFDKKTCMKADDFMD